MPNEIAELLAELVPTTRSGRKALWLLFVVAVFTVMLWFILSGGPQ